MKWNEKCIGLLQEREVESREFYGLLSIKHIEQRTERAEMIKCLIILDKTVDNTVY